MRRRARRGVAWLVVFPCDGLEVTASFYSWDGKTGFFIGTTTGFCLQLTSLTGMLYHSHIPYYEARAADETAADPPRKAPASVGNGSTLF